MRIFHLWRIGQQEHTNARGESWNDDVYIIRPLDGTFSDPNSLTHDLRKAEVALDLPRVSFHDLRHTHATLLLEAGISRKTVGDRLGHSSIHVTADIYAYTTDAMQ